MTIRASNDTRGTNKGGADDNQSGDIRAPPLPGACGWSLDIVEGAGRAAQHAGVTKKKMRAKRAVLKRLQKVSSGAHVALALSPGSNYAKLLPKSAG